MPLCPSYLPPLFSASFMPPLVKHDKLHPLWGLGVSSSWSPVSAHLAVPLLWDCWNVTLVRAHIPSPHRIAAPPPPPHVHNLAHAFYFLLWNIWAFDVSPFLFCCLSGHLSSCKVWATLLHCDWRSAWWVLCAVSCWMDLLDEVFIKRNDF